MSERIFLAGATGAIGRMLVPLLVRAGHTVYGTTRRADNHAMLEKLGAIPVVVDVFDRDALADAMSDAVPGVVIHQLTDLPPGLDPQRMAEATARNARIRTEGTCNLVDTALAAGCGRMIAQSIAWAYAPGDPPLTETHPFDLDATGARRISVDGVIALERAVLETPGLDGTALRYGQLYGPGTGIPAAGGASPLHVEAAAWAAALALEHGVSGAFNVAEDGAAVSSAKARRAFHWTPDLRLPQDGAHIVEQSRGAQ